MLMLNFCEKQVFDTLSNLTFTENKARSKVHNFQNYVIFFFKAKGLKEACMMNKKNALKGKLCEICGSVANQQCQQCGVSFYWLVILPKNNCFVTKHLKKNNDILKKCCNEIKQIRTKKIFISENDRKKHQEAVLKINAKLLEESIVKCEEHLANGKNMNAIACGLQALKSTRELFGIKSEKLIPILLMLSKASICSRLFKQCEKFISLCKLIIYSNKCNDYLLLSQFHRLKGRLHLLQKQYDKAGQEFSKDVKNSLYFVGQIKALSQSGIISKINKHMSFLFRFISAPYFAGQNIFEQQLHFIKCHKCKTSNFYNKIVDIWLEYLKKCKERTSKITMKESKLLLEDIGEHQFYEALQMIENIRTCFQNSLGKQDLKLGQVDYALGLMHDLAGHDIDQFHKYYINALNIFRLHLGEAHCQTKQLYQHLDYVNK
ncbi:MYND finger family protein [Reticulomyxa filosa]|uniref:MYND finger family protein n=1 Tax=Reticulomyxa filosa TaxID=46433 RepID=X6MFF0_RETFI|nr:MYND finger family protein [Reticulomyxa filosa]|eukprot:ETO11770.1 MYND finger family protein [Reticulomyxa filosa]